MTTPSISLTSPSFVGVCVAFIALACSGAKDSSQDTAQSAQAVNPDAPIIRGTVTSVSTNQLVLKVDTGAVSVTLTQPFQLYSRVPSDLSHVKENSFIGVTSVKQPDGSERATEIHVFPEELRGLGEGSRMMAPDTSSNRSRMTNGNVSASRVTNGAASQSRMSNGNVSSTSGTSLVVQYAGGSQTVTVRANTQVTELQLSSKPVVVGDRLAVMAKRNADGSLSADKAVSTAR